MAVYNAVDQNACTVASLLVLHGLEIANVGSKLLALPQVWHRGVECTLRKTHHLRPNPNSAFVQNLNGVSVGGKVGHLLSYARLATQKKRLCRFDSY